MNDVTAMQPALNKAQDGQEITARHAIDGATNLLEAGIQMHLLASYWFRLHTLGWTLDRPARDNSAVLVAPEGWEA